MKRLERDTATYFEGRPGNAAREEALIEVALDHCSEEIDLDDWALSEDR